VTGLLALHGGGEYVAGDEAAMDALVAAAVDAASREGEGVVPRIVLIPTAAAGGRPDLAAANGERAFAAAASRGRVPVEIGVAGILSRADAADPRVLGPLEAAHLVHFPGGDPDRIPAVFAGSPAWAALLGAYAGVCVLAGASAGAMALAGRCWTPGGMVDGLGLLRGYAILPHDGPGRLERWGATGPDTAWLGLAEQTLVIGRPGGAWAVSGRGRARVIGSDGRETAGGSAGSTLLLPAP
jgi:cyanophycinase-like exopeptidase